MRPSPQRPTGAASHRAARDPVPRPIRTEPAERQHATATATPSARPPTHPGRASPAAAVQGPATAPTTHSTASPRMTTAQAPTASSSPSPHASAHAAARPCRRGPRRRGPMPTATPHSPAGSSWSNRRIACRCRRASRPSCAGRTPMPRRGGGCAMSQPKDAELAAAAIQDFQDTFARRAPRDRPRRGRPRRRRSTSS